jgi:excisionase family DNA binding protein
MPGAGGRLCPEETCEANRIQAMSKATEAKFSIDRVATILGICRPTVERLMRFGRLGYYQVGDRRIVGEGHLNSISRSLNVKAK